MRRRIGLAVGLVSLFLAGLAAQSGVVLGDRSTELRPLGGEGNVGISNAVLREQPEVRVLRVVVEPGGSRVMHSHDDVRFHLFAPISGSMMLDLEGAASVEVPPWQPYYMQAGTRHAFRNTGPTAVEVMEIFVR